MNKFITCGCDGEILINLEKVKKIIYRDKVWKAAMVVMENGDMEELWHKYLCTPRVEDCIVEL